MEADPWASVPRSLRPTTSEQSGPSASNSTLGSPLAKAPSVATSPNHGPSHPLERLDEEDADASLLLGDSTIYADDMNGHGSEINPDKELGSAQKTLGDLDISKRPAEKESTSDLPDENLSEGSNTAEFGADEFDEFDEFDEAGPSTLTPGQATIDEFDDFDDFAEGTADQIIEEPAQTIEPEVQRWLALRLDPMPDTADLVAQLEEILRPVLVDGRDVLTDEPPRQVGGLAQIMIGESSREAYAQLTTAPMLKTLDWTRSRVRRDHLISMGVPVNLDEVDSHRLSSLPPLRITTNPDIKPHRASTESYSRSATEKGKGRAESAIHSVPVSAVNGEGADRKTKEKYGLEQMPLFDATKAEDLCGIDENQLSLWSVEKLRAIQEELVQTTAAASALLAWQLQYKDAQVQDSETYNGMISEMIANAAKAKSAQSAASGGVFKRASMRLPGGGSPGLSPRVGSPAMR